MLNLKQRPQPQQPKDPSDITPADFAFAVVSCALALVSAWVAVTLLFSL